MIEALVWGGCASVVLPFRVWLSGLVCLFVVWCVGISESDHDV